MLATDHLHEDEIRGDESETYYKGKQEGWGTHWLWLCWFISWHT